MWRTGISQWNDVRVLSMCNGYLFWPSWHAIPDWLSAFLWYHLGALGGHTLQTTVVLLRLAMAQYSPHKSGGRCSGIAVMGGPRPEGRGL